MPEEEEPLFFDAEGRPLDPSQLSKEQLAQIMLENAKEFDLEAAANSDLIMDPQQPLAPETLLKMEQQQEMEQEMNNLMGDGAADSDDQIAK